ncbi:MAG: hypothetical protein IIA68_05140, partial [Proteobacteria bacterium]|nr:hypothetical protein [Pseudomonadota bacterium]
MPDRHASADRAGPPPANPGPDPREARVSVLLPLPLAGAYDYLAPADLALGPGDVVRVPLGGREVT